MSRGTFATGVAVRSALARQLGEPTPRGFEDRGSDVRGRPSGYAVVRKSACNSRGYPTAGAVIRQFGCHLGCQRWNELQILLCGANDSNTWSRWNETVA